MLRHRVRGLVLAGSLTVSAVASILVSAPPAVADTIDNLVPTPLLNVPCLAGMDSNRLCQTDNKDWYFYMDSSGEYELEQVDRDKVYQAMYDEYAPTQLNVNEDTTPVFSGSGETDLIFQEGAIPFEGAAGITWCNDVVNGSSIRCDQHYVRIVGGGGYTKKRACHEAGHALGLTHPANSELYFYPPDNSYHVWDNLTPAFGCMRTPTDNSTVTGDLGANQVSNINAVY